MAALAGRRAGGILLCTVTRLDISATAIRGQVAADRSPRFLLPDSVLALIEAHGCYR
jgi:nicotinate-nucleotide adenylyltransferase